MLPDVSEASSERVVVDPNELDPSGATTIDWFVPSPDGRLVAVSLSSHGTEDGSLHLFDVSTGKLVDVQIPRITVMGGSLAWRGDGGGFWYTRYPAPGERGEEDLPFYQEVWFHEIGATDDRQDLAGVFADDRIGQGSPRASSIHPTASAISNAAARRMPTGRRPYAGHSEGTCGASAPRLAAISSMATRSAELTLSPSSL
jgi:prolyl oligopeptidase